MSGGADVTQVCGGHLRQPTATQHITRSVTGLPLIEALNGRSQMLTSPHGNDLNVVCGSRVRNCSATDARTNSNEHLPRGCVLMRAEVGGRPLGGGCPDAALLAT